MTEQTYLTAEVAEPARPETDSWDYKEPEKSDLAQKDLTENVPSPPNEEQKQSVEEVKAQPETEDHPNWIPPHLRKPEDEFVDLSTIEPLHSVVIDDGLEILTTLEGKGYLPEPGDTVYYKHQTRFDNGQLCNFDERRKVVDMVVIDNLKYQRFLNECFKAMRRG